MDAFRAELLKIPPVTRFLCISILSVTLPVMLKIVSPYWVVFVWDFVVRRFEVWRIITSFFVGSSGINFLFDVVMLYRNSNQLEEGPYHGRSADYAWQLILAALGIIALNAPLSSYTHTRPLLLTLTYLSSVLAPPGTQTNIMGLITFPIVYLPYGMVAMDLVMGGPAAAASGVSGLVVGHLWWWSVFGDAAGGSGGWARAPGWLRSVVGDGPGGVGETRSSVHVTAPRRPATEAGSSSGGHQWGSGNRLGS